MTLEHEFLFQLHNVILLYFIPLFKKITFVNFNDLVLSRICFAIGFYLWRLRSRGLTLTTMNFRGGYGASTEDAYVDQ